MPQRSQPDDPRFSNLKPELDHEPGNEDGPWVLICPEHFFCSNFRTKRQAQAVARGGTQEFCEVCNGQTAYCFTCRLAFETWMDGSHTNCEVIAAKKPGDSVDELPSESA